MERKKIFTIVTKTDSHPDGTASATITTESLDRDHDRISVDGLKTDSFLKNPVVLFGHDYHELPVGRATELLKETDRIRARWKWLEGDPLASRVRNAWDQGIIQATSIGFMPLRWVENSEGGHDFLEAELLEFSVVPIGSNPEAIRRLKSLGLQPMMYLKTFPDRGEVFDVDPREVRAIVQKEIIEALTSLTGRLY
jgi:HK97 family phage prohead protease